MARATANLEKTLNDAIGLHQSGDMRAASKLYRRILKRFPQHADALHLLGVAQHQLGHNREAETLIRRAVSVNPDAPAYRYNLTNVLLAAGKPDMALAILETLVASDNGNPDFQFNLGLAYAGVERYADAIAAFERTMEVEPLYPGIHLNAGNAYYRNNDLERAIDHLQQAIAIDSESYEAHFNLGGALWQLGRLSAAGPHLLKAALLKHRPGQQSVPAERLSKAKLKHDIEQLGYLGDLGLLPAAGPDILASLQESLAAFPLLPEGERYARLPRGAAARLAPYLNKILYLHPEERMTGGTLNPGLDVEQIENAYLARTPSIVHFDDFLHDACLARLRQFCLTSTVWFRDTYAGGYLGAFVEDGFVCPLLLQIAEDLQTTFPRIFGPHRLDRIWAFKYDSDLKGIEVHADEAAVNLNFWITPDAANANPNTGGLLLWDQMPPLDWRFDDYNSDARVADVMDFLADAEVVRVPYRCNRAVVFDSELLHKTDDIDFRAGYENRRINITMLFGERQR